MKINITRNQILTIISKLFLFISILLTAILTSVLTYKINEFLEPSGKPNIIAKISGFTFRQDIKTNKCTGEIFINILNADDEKTLISIENLLIEIPSINIKPLVINSSEKIELNPYSYKSRSINYDLGTQPLIQTDSLEKMNIILKGNCFYPFGEIADKLYYNINEDPTFRITHIWRNSKLKQYYSELHLLSENNKLPEEWQRCDVEYGHNKYDCYYKPSSYKLGIIQEGEIFKVKHLYKDSNFLKLGPWNKIEQFDFIPNPAIRDHFVDLNIRTVRYNPIIYKDQNATVLKTYKFNIHENYKNLICFRMNK